MLLSACGGGGRGGGPTLPTPPRVDLTGQVTSAGAPVPGAQVLVGQSPTVADGAGRFSYSQLPTGTYTYAAQDADGGALGYGTVELLAAAETLAVPLGATAGFAVRTAEPALNTPSVPLGQRIRLELTAPVDPSSLSPAQFSFAPDIGAFRLAAAGSSIILTPERQLPAGQQVTLTVSGQIRSAAEELLHLPLRLRFRTAATDSAPPVLIQTTPAAGATDWPINLAVRFEFNEPLDAELAAASVDVSPATPVTLRASGSTLLVVPTAGWARDTPYTMTVAGVADRLGNAMPTGETLTLEFTSGSLRAPVANIQPEWNRSRGEIVFSSNRGGEYSVYSIQPDGGALTQLTFGPDDELHPSLSADGALLAWQARGDGGDWDIFVGERADTSDARAVTAPGVNDTEPVFTRTGSRNILFVSTRLGTPVIHRMGPDGSGSAPLADTFGNQRSPAPHPLIDNQLLFVGTTDLRREIYSMSVSAIDGSATVLRLSGLRLSDEYDPDWGVDASFIAYVSDFSGAPELWVATLGAPQGRQVTELGDVGGPSLAPTPGDSRCVISLGRPDGGSDLVLIDIISGGITINLTAEAGD